MPERIGLDFETYSDVDLPTHGLERYVTGDEFKILLSGVEFDNRAGYCLDHVQGADSALEALENSVKDRIVIGHNVGFEKRVLKTVGLDRAPVHYIDSAVATRVHGGSGSLAAASRQFLPTRKMEEGVDLIKLFCMPSKEQRESGNLAFDPSLILGDGAAKWRVFKKYCQLDAQLSLRLESEYPLPIKEQSYWEITDRMNNTGWPVDRDSVEEMYARYLENLGEALSEFHHKYGNLNVNSLKQLKEWCADRGVKATSFDEKHVDKLLRAVNNKCGDATLPSGKWEKYDQVRDLLQLKQLLGGSSLKKLKVVLDTISQDADGIWRLRDQYMHSGAPQTLRTTGRSVQMQNLKRLTEDVKDMDTLHDPDVDWSNDELATNIRQVFTSSDPDGALIVGDFSSVEARGLAWLAGEDWKLKAFAQGKDLYKVLAGRIYHLSVEAVSKPQRTFGKVGELSCGYGAGGPAVKAFAENMGVMLTEAEAADLVSNWRNINPDIVKFWMALDEMLHAVMVSGGESMYVGSGAAKLEFVTVDAPKSLQDLTPVPLKTLEVKLKDNEGNVYMRRRFHGVHVAGRNIRYFKPSKNKTGEVWINNYIDPKTKERRFYELYGGKLAGIITQSFCRELFFDQLAKVDTWCNSVENVDLVGQFHDEIVLDWRPRETYSSGPASGHVGLGFAMGSLESFMSNSTKWPTFPLAAEIKHDYRYTK